MRIFYSGAEIEELTSPVVTVGSFDGVHTGHRAIIDTLKQCAEERGVKSVIVTLWPHPRVVLEGGISDFSLLNSMREKKYLLDKAGVDRLVILEFSKKTSELSGEEFIHNFLLGRLNAGCMVVGYNHHFGSGRECDKLSLEAQSEKLGFDVIKVDKFGDDDTKISSTSIRDLLKNGDIESANVMLGYPYMFLCPVNASGVFQSEESLKLIPGAGTYRGEMSASYIKPDSPRCEIKIEINEEGKMQIISKLNPAFIDNNLSQINFLGKI